MRVDRAAKLVRKAAPALGFVEPVAPAEGDEGDMDKARFEIRPEHHRDHSPAASMPDEPSRERPVEPNARSGIVGDGPEQVVDLVEPPFGRREVALGDLEDMVDYSITSCRTRGWRLWRTISRVRSFASGEVGRGAPALRR